MQLYHFLIVALLLCLEAHAFFGPEFKPSSPGFHIRRTSKLRDSTGYRLPGTARPSKYDLTLTFAIGDAGKFIKGDVNITLDVDNTNENGTFNLQLNSDNETLIETVLWNNQTNCTSSAGSDFLEIKCPEMINGINQTLQIKYTRKFGGYDMNGAYLVKYNESGKEETMVATQFEQGYARRIMPCFDEPEYKAPIQLTLQAYTNYTNVSHWVANTKVVSSSEVENITSTTFAPTPNMSTYLLAFIATRDFKNFTNHGLKNASYQFNVFARPSAENFTSVALENGPKLIDLMGNFTGIPYGASMGNDKMTFAAIPEFSAGAMENWGLITFREQILVDEGSNTTGRDKQYIIEVIAHELTHQWFGDYVTMDWWSETWLNEGFAEYFEYYLTNEISDDFHMMEQLVIKEQQVALKADAYPDTIPLSNNASDVTTADDFSNEFGDISYSKGASIIKMIRYAVGDDAFQTGLHNYLTANNFSNPTAEILIDTLQDVLPADSPLKLQTLLNAWIYEGGYPILDVSLDSANNVTIQSTKFSSSLNKTGENNTANWWIPLTYATSDKPNFTDINFQWIDPAKVNTFSVNISNSTESWIIFNLQSAGFYRVNYDDTLWSRIINVLNNSETYSTIDVLNRAQLLDDAFNIARSYEGNDTDLKGYYLTAFKLAEYLKFETEYYPWYTFFVEMQYLMEKIQDDTALETLKETILEIVSPQLKIPSASNKTTHTETLMQNLLLSWGCRVGHQECIQWAQKEFESYKNDSASIDNNYRDIILCTGLANSNSSTADFESVFKQLKESILPFEEKDLAKALTCLQEESLINKTLQSTIATSPPFSRMFFDTILSGLISDGHDKVGIALEFVLTNYNDITQYWQPIETPEAALKKVAAKIYSEDYIDLIQSWIHNNNDEDSDKMKNAASEAIEVGKKNQKWLEKYGDVLTSVIVYNGDGDDITTPTTNTPTKTTKTTATTKTAKTTATTKTTKTTTTSTTTQPETTTQGAEKMSYNVLLIIMLIPIMKMLYY